MTELIFPVGRPDNSGSGYGEVCGLWYGHGCGSGLGYGHGYGDGSGYGFGYYHGDGFGTGNGHGEYRDKSERVQIGYGFGTVSTKTRRR